MSLFMHTAIMLYSVLDRDQSEEYTPAMKMNIIKYSQLKYTSILRTEMNMIRLQHTEKSI